MENLHTGVVPASLELPPVSFTKAVAEESSDEQSRIVPDGENVLAVFVWVLSFCSVGIVLASRWKEALDTMPLLPLALILIGAIVILFLPLKLILWRDKRG